MDEVQSTLAEGNAMAEPEFMHESMYFAPYTHSDKSLAPIPAMLQCPLSICTTLVPST